VYDCDTAKTSGLRTFEPGRQESARFFLSQTVKIDAFLGLGISSSECKELIIVDSVGRA
jgi:hypothetical protein